MSQDPLDSEFDAASDAVELAVARLRAAGSGDGDLCSPLVSAVSMRGAVVSTLGHPLGTQTVCASSRLAARIDEIQIDLGEGPSWDALRTRRPVSSPDLQREGGDSWPSTWSALRELDVGALYAFPLYVGTIGVGSVALYSMIARRLSGAEMEGMQELAAIVSALLLRRALDRLDESEDEAADEPFSRREMHQATGMVAARTGLPVDDALLLVRGHAFATGRPVREVADDIIARRLDLGAGFDQDLG